MSLSKKITKNAGVGDPCQKKGTSKDTRNSFWHSSKKHKYENMQIGKQIQRIIKKKGKQTAA